MPHQRSFFCSRSTESCSRFPPPGNFACLHTYMCFSIKLRMLRRPAVACGSGRMCAVLWPPSHKWPPVAWTCPASGISDPTQLHTTSSTASRFSAGQTQGKGRGAQGPARRAGPPREGCKAAGRCRGRRRHGGRCSRGGCRRGHCGGRPGHPHRRGLPAAEPGCTAPCRPAPGHPPPPGAGLDAHPGAT